MRFARRWTDQPQSVWLRKANFQIHLWAGIGVGLYVFVVCVTGSALVFRPELTRQFPGRSTGFAIVTWLLDLHDNLLAGSTGRYVNGVGGLFLTVLALTGAVIWWPGIKNWRRSLTLHRDVNWKRFT